MNKTMEKELKLRITDAANLKYLLEALPRPIRIESQVNHYFDTPGRDLRKHGVMVRLRESTAGNQLTLKRKAKIVSGYLTAEECEESTTLRARDLGPEGTLEVFRMTPGIARILSGEYGLTEIKRLGLIRNERRVIPMKEGFTVELDETIFPGGRIDHEIEVETENPGAALEVLERILDGCGIPFDFETQTKYTRFIETAD